MSFGVVTVPDPEVQVFQGPWARFFLAERQG